MKRNSLVVVVACLGAFWATPGYAAEGFSANMRQRPSAALRVSGVPIHSAKLIHRVYELAGFRPLWDPSRVSALETAIDGLSRDGLTPSEYRFDAAAALLVKQRAGALSDSERVDLELLLWEGYIRAVYNLAFGKVDATSLDPDINFTRNFSGRDPAPDLLAAIKSGKIADIFDRVRPQPTGYEAMRGALARYRAYQEAGGWQPIAAGKTLEVGALGPRVVALRERLRATGDFSGVAAEPQLFDADLEAAVKGYQRRVGLDVDGVVGPGTLRELNIPVQERIDQIRVNLERQRWIMHEVYDELIVVDVAGFEILWIKGPDVLWRAKVQVGKEYTSSPLFKAEIEQVVFNPSWTIPPGIMRRSIVPKLKKNPNYLQEKGFLLLTQDGKEVDPATVDFSALKGFPYIVRQPPGPNNALGLVKFLFPNPHFVFLHDTNHRDLFDRRTRTFSSGCIRLEHPFDLAERLLAGQGGWTRAKIDEVVASGKTKTVNLEHKMRIVIAYHTVVVRDGRVQFREDVYDRDGKLLEALDGPFRVRRKDAESPLGVS